MADLEPQLRNFEKLGFRHIGTSDLFTQGQFVIEKTLGKETSIMVDFAPDINWPDVIGLKPGESSKTSLIILTKDGVAIETDITGTSGGVSKDKIPTETEFNGKTTEIQLFEAGFNFDEKDKNIFKKKVNEWDF